MEQRNVEAAAPAAAPLKGRAVAAKNWTAAEGLLLINEAKALGIDDTTVSNDPRWATLGNKVAETLKVSSRTSNSNVDHFKAMIKLVRSICSAFSMENSENDSAVVCPLLTPSADEQTINKFNEGNIS